MTNGWNEWSRHVLKELERLNDCLQQLATDYNRVSSDIRALQVKAGIWGAIGGAIPVAIGILIMLLRSAK